jgi:hypothetical protein
VTLVACRVVTITIGIEHDVIARGAFAAYIQAYSANAHPIRWKYLDATHRIRSNDPAATG